MSSSPEQPPSTGGTIPHNMSTSSMASTLSVGSGCDSPPHASPGQLLHVQHPGLTPTSTPNSPQISSRYSSGKLGRGECQLLCFKCVNQLMVNYTSMDIEHLANTCTYTLLGVFAS